MRELAGTGVLYQRLADRAVRTPDAAALFCGAVGAEQPLSYRDLFVLVDAAERRCRAEGLAAGDFIGWLGHNSAQMLAALLACARVGAVFVPLNWRLAPAELAAIARHAGLSALWHTPEAAALARQVLDAAACRGPAAAAQAGDLLAVYTSGTSGQPKAALHTQAGMLANLEIALAVQQLTAADRVLAVLPMFHVGGLCIQLLPALAAGAALRLQPRFDAGAWLDEVASWRPTTSLLVPATMQAIVEHPGWPAADLSSLRFVNSGSSVVPLHLIEAFHARDVPVAQVYGSTETGPFSIALRPDQALDHAGQAGLPASAVELRLVDSAGLDVAEGAVGEIWLRAPNLMRGYHRLPPGTGFIDGWFATGDLARADPQGFVTVVGRGNDMIISGGENIHPAEIENLAAAWPGVAEAVVVGLPDAAWGEVPALVLLPQTGRTVDVDALRAHLALCLARYKLPRRVALADDLPRTALGKVQRTVLVRRLLEG